MEGRIQKAHEGKWNGGFAPYGYQLVEGKFQINEEEPLIFMPVMLRIIGLTKYKRVTGARGSICMGLPRNQKLKELCGESTKVLLLMQMA